MCVAPAWPGDFRPYPLDERGGVTYGSYATFAEAEAICDGLMMRLCTQRELSAGLCCGGSCAFDDARVWTSEDCTLPSEHAPIDALPLKPHLLRVSVNGQQFSAITPHFEEPALPRDRSRDVPTSVPGFTFFDPSLLALSAIVPDSGPTGGGTLVTLIGLGFADLNAHVGFVPSNHTTAAAVGLARAEMALGAFRGRLLTCRTPPSPTGSGGTVRVELSLNGEPLPPAMSETVPPDALRFTYVGDGD
jgi:hypothetical protein